MTYNIANHTNLSYEARYARVTSRNVRSIIVEDKRNTPSMRVFFSENAEAESVLELSTRMHNMGFLR